MDKSSVLFVTICSNRKIRGGDRSYDASRSICSFIPRQANDLMQKRRRILELLMGSDTSRQGVLLRDLPYNIELVDGPDFGGSATGRYKQAVERYQGRFYSEMGESGVRLLSGTPHHVLIISGLYGLLIPGEPIQAYSCHLLDHPQITQTWTVGGSLTGFLLSYSRECHIKRIYDFTGHALYRDLVDWSRVHKSVDVLHGFGDQNAGPAVLPAIAVVTKQLLQESEQYLLELPAGKRISGDYEEISFQKVPEPPLGFPVEEAQGVLMGEKGDPAVASAAAPPLPAVLLQVSPSVLPHPRDILVTGGEHNTMFDKKIHSMQDLPAEVMPTFQSISRCPEVLEIYFGRFGARGDRSKKDFTVTLSVPQEDSGRIHGKLEGSGKIGHWQLIEIRVTRGREIGTFLLLQRLLEEPDH